jgi:molybdopterin synthase catalytic subunit
VKVKVLGFATAAEALGAAEVTVELDEGSRLADLRRRLEAGYPRLAEIWPRLAVAVDGTLAEPDEELAEGAEVALLPPVSGGAEPRPAAPLAADRRTLTGLTDGALDADRVAAAVAAPECGAVVVFLGTVRDHHAGRPVTRLTYSADRPMAETVLRRIAADLEAGADRLRAAIVHRLGEVPVGEPSVVIAVASPHRAAAYEASRTALERLKREAPIWKREHYADGEAAWREEEALSRS